MTRVLLILGLVVLLSPTSAGAQGDAQAVIKKAIQAFGGEETLAQVQAVHTKIKGVLHEVEGATFTGELWRQGLDRYRYALRTEVNGVILALVTVANGDQVWVKVNDQVEETQPHTRAAMKRGMYVDRVANLLPLLKEKEFNLTATGEVTRDGVALQGVKVTRKDQPDVLLCFDKDKGLLVRMEYRNIDETVGKEVAVVAVYSEHRELNPTEPEEATLKAAKVGTDGPALLEFVRKRALTPAARDRLAALVRRLSAEAFNEREEAARELIAAGSAAIPVLTVAARSTDPEVAQRAKDCLEKVKGDQDAGVTFAALRLLAHRRPAGAVEALLDFLPTAVEEKLAREIRFTLAALATRDGKPEKALLDALEDKDAARRAAAQAALGKDDGALLKEAGRRLFLPKVLTATRVVEYREGKKYIEWQRLEVTFYNRFENAVFAKP